LNLPYSKKKEQIDLLVSKNPNYAQILHFYEKIIELQDATSPALNVDSPQINEKIKAFHEKEGFPLIARNEFLIDIPSSLRLFESICTVGKNASKKMRDNISILEEAITINALRIEDLLRRHSDDAFTTSVARDFDVDRTVLSFLIHMSIYPSLHTHAGMLLGQADMKKWLRGYCPVCGSLPSMSVLRGEGQRYFQCSFCGSEWPAERLMCPFCENKDHNKLHYFYAEDDEARRVDLCDHCGQYIKTVDARKLNYEPDLNLEDITTIHLDILASEKDFKRPVPSPWGL
jgi:FdhE protein